MAERKTYSNCAKKPFRTKRLALEAKEKINNAPRKGQKAEIKNVYKCSECGEWHLTSLTKDHAKLIQDKKEFRETSGNIDSESIQKRINFLEKVYKRRHK